MSVASGVGSLPGTDPAEAARLVVGEVPDLPYLPELPARGAPASMSGRALAVVSGLAADLQPAGWRLTGGTTPGRDQRRARSLLAQDLDHLEEELQGFQGTFKVQVAGPWTLAATVERPRGDKLLADAGARRDLAQSLAEGLRTHLADVRRRVAQAERLVVQVDEPVLGAVLAARIPTASGFGKHRAVDRPELSEHLGWVLAAAAEGAEPWVHSCASDTPLDLVRAAGARGLSVDLGLVDAAGHEVLAQALEAGETVAVGVVPAVDPAVPPSDRSLTDRVLVWLDQLGLDPEEAGPRIVVTPTCGLAGAGPEWVRRSMLLARQVAANLTGSPAPVTE